MHEHALSLIHEDAPVAYETLKRTPIVNEDFGRPNQHDGMRFPESREALFNDS
jgi:hypothetical protein